MTTTGDESRMDVDAAMDKGGKKCKHGKGKGKGKQRFSTPPDHPMTGKWESYNTGKGEFNPNTAGNRKGVKGKGKTRPPSLATAASVAGKGTSRPSAGGSRSPWPPWRRNGLVLRRPSRA